MTHQLPITPRWRKTPLALAACAVLLPVGAAWSIDLVQAPPSTVQPYVRPNVIISVDDSGSMGWRLDKSSSGGVNNNIKTPKSDGTWDDAAPRMNILKYSLAEVFNDYSLLPNDKLRLAWQVMWSNSNSADAKNVNSSTMKTNSMRTLDETHRENFLTFVSKLTPGSNTPSHRMFSQADAYMRRTLSKNSPWAYEPGTTGEPYLACRRNYHIMMTDGRWNNSPSDVPNTAWRDNATNLTLPDGTIYGGSTAAERAKSALYRDTRDQTLADWAFYSWAKPLQETGLTGEVQPSVDYLNAPAEENFGPDSSGNDAILERYWNPRYNPATWPHMVTYTIGFSDDAITWPGASHIVAPTETVPFGYDESFRNLVTGNQTWPAMSAENRRALDLWHAALNGRGRFYAVNKAEDLEKAFREIFEQINSTTEADTGSVATSGASISRNKVGLFAAAYEPEESWRGYISSYIVQADDEGGSSIVSNPDWNNKTTADRLDALSNIGDRVVLTWSDQATQGAPFRWDELDGSQQEWLQKNSSTNETDDLGEARLEFVRGDRSMESSGTGEPSSSAPFRKRQSRQGDIINSEIWYVSSPASNYPLSGYSDFTLANDSRTPMIYVGGNDGMLHGFVAEGVEGGTEKIAYIPRGVIPRLNRLTDPSYQDKHRYFVDGSPMSGDVDLNTQGQTDDAMENSSYESAWRTMLVGTLGAGGKGYFVLDITDPAEFSEGNAGTLVRLDRTRSADESSIDHCEGLSGEAASTCEQAAVEDADIGHITAQPVKDDSNPLRSTQITLMNNNRWAVVLGNGYNSANQRAVLLIQYLDGNQELLRIPTTMAEPGHGLAQDNGLSAPRLIDLNGDGRVDLVYAGDNQGNMWKFDLTHSDDSHWAAAYGSDTPLFTARGPSSLGSPNRPKIQPITAPATVRANDRLMTVGTGGNMQTVPVGGLMVAFGTGRNVGQFDAESIDVHTLYSVLDNARYKLNASDNSLGTRLEIVSTDPVPEPLGTMGDTGSLSGGGQLAQQKITELGDGLGTVDTVDELKQDTWSSFNGWYLDFPSVGERLLKPMEFYDGSNLLTVYSQVPTRGSYDEAPDPDFESCDVSTVNEERQYRTLINIMDGKRPSVQLVDANKDGIFSSAGLNDDGDGGVSRTRVTRGSHVIIAQGHLMLDIDASDGKEELARLPEQALRPSWRQVK